MKWPTGKQLALAGAQVLLAVGVTLGLVRPECVEPLDVARLLLGLFA